MKINTEEPLKIGTLHIKNTMMTFLKPLRREYLSTIEKISGLYIEIHCITRESWTQVARLVVVSADHPASVWAEPCKYSSCADTLLHACMFTSTQTTRHTHNYRKHWGKDKCDQCRQRNASNLDGNQQFQPQLLPPLCTSPKPHENTHRQHQEEECMMLL